MSQPSRSTLWRVATITATVAGAAAVVLLLRGNPAQAQAQGPMSAPACQCSTPTAIPGMTSRIAHCLCGALSCAIVEAPEPARSTAMQCVRQ